MHQTGGLDLGSHSDINVQVNCTFGEGPDVALDITAPLDRLEGNHPRGFIPIDLSSDEAIALGQLLIESGKEAQRLAVIQY